MATSTINRHPKSTIELEITIPWSEIKDTYNRIFEYLAGEIELPGFRKGKAPKDLVEKNVDKTKIYEEVVKEIIPKVYTEALKTHAVKPIISPRVQILAAKEDADWKIKATVAEKPEVALNNYKSAVAKVQGGASKLWIPGQAEKKENKEEVAQTKLDEVIKALLSEVVIEIPDILIEDEVNRMLSRLVDQTQKLGLTVEQYLVAQGKTSESLRSDYTRQAAEAIKLEYVLDKVAEVENITVTPEEIEKMIQTAKDSKEQEKLRSNSYYLATLIRQQKTLDSLIKPVV